MDNIDNINNIKNIDNTDRRRMYTSHGSSHTYTIDPDYDPYNLKVKYLDNDHFKYGTYRILEDNCKYILKEDIEFNPHSDYKYSPNEENAYFPGLDESDKYPGSNREPGTFRLGFFAAISIESNNIVIDLNGHEIKYHKEFLMQQRFGSLIEIGKGPFLDGQGPSKFGEDFEVQNIVIKNGKLGLVSHHGMLYYLSYEF